MAEARRIWSFHGGLHLDDHKTESTGQPVRRLPMPDRLTLPLHQHIGLRCRTHGACGRTGEEGPGGGAGQRLCQRIDPCTDLRPRGRDRPAGNPHPSGLHDTCIVIETDGDDAWADLPEPCLTTPQCLPPNCASASAGPASSDSAVPPLTAVKVNTSGQRPIDTLIINAAECEPYITCDDMLMREQAADVVDGIGILRHLVGARHCLDRYRDNKPQAAETLRQALSTKAIPGPRSSSYRRFTRVAAKSS